MIKLKLDIHSLSGSLGLKYFYQGESEQ